MSTCLECARRQTALTSDKHRLSRLAHTAAANAQERTEHQRSNYARALAEIPIAKAHVAESRDLLEAHLAECTVAA